MIFDLLKDYNEDFNFSDKITESKYVEKVSQGNVSQGNVSQGNVSQENVYSTFLKCIICEFDPVFSSLNEGEKKHYLSQKIMEICSYMDEKDKYFKDYNFHKSIKSHKIQQGLQLYEKRINHLSSLYYLNEYYKKHFVIVYKKIAYPTCIKNYPKIYLQFQGKIRILNDIPDNYPVANIKELIDQIGLVDDIKRDIKGIYNLHLEAISKYKLEDLKKIAEECNISLNNNTKNKTKSVLYDEINMYYINR